jgi:hypothetical protein
VPGATRRLGCSGRPEPLARELGQASDIDHRRRSPPDRGPHGRIVGPNARIRRSQRVSGRRVRSRSIGGPGPLVVHPSSSRTVEHANVRVAVELHQPERERRGVAVAHQRRAGIDTRADEQAFHRRRIQQSVLAVLQVAVDVPEHGTGNVTLVVRRRGSNRCFPAVKAGCCSPTWSSIAIMPPAEIDSQTRCGPSRYPHRQPRGSTRCCRSYAGSSGRTRSRVDRACACGCRPTAASMWRTLRWRFTGPSRRSLSVSGSERGRRL